jgi:hypothetical protein
MFQFLIAKDDIFFRGEGDGYDCGQFFELQEPKRSYKYAAKNPHACVWDESRFSFA